MIASQASKNSNALTLVRHGQGAEGGEKWETVSTPPLSRIIFDAESRGRCIPLHTALSVFDLLPAASATAGKDALTFSLGTGTEVIARAAKGGVTVTTQASTPAASDNAMLVPATSSTLIVPITAVSQPRFSTRINVPVISDPTSDATLVTSALLVFAGLNETLTHVDPTTDAGDGAGFIYAPNPGVAGAPVALTTPTGLAAATGLNWILHQKVAGADTFVDSGVAVIAGQDYELEVQYGPDLIPLFYINGALITNALAIAGTTGHSVGIVVGTQIMNSTPAGQLGLDVRYVAVERFLG